MEEVIGSIPIRSTKSFNDYDHFSGTVPEIWEQFGNTVALPCGGYRLFPRPVKKMVDVAELCASCPFGSEYRPPS